MLKVLLILAVIGILGFLIMQPRDDVKVEASYFQELNEFRVSQGYSELAWSDGLYKLAKDHSQWMDSEGRLKHSDYPYAENIFKSAGWGGTDVIHYWKISPSHNSIMCNSQSSYGAIGVNGDYVTFLCY